MVTEERVQCHRQIIRQAANAELLAEDHNQSRFTSICHVYLRKQMLSCQSLIQHCLTDCLIPATCCVCAQVFLHFPLNPLCQFMIKLCLFSVIAPVLPIQVKPQNVCTDTHTNTHTHTHLICRDLIDNPCRLGFILLPWPSDEMLA